MDFTPKQLQYLFYIDYFKDSERPVTNLAEQLGVTKGAVSQAIDLYGKKGWLTHSPYGGIALEGAAVQAIAEIKEKHRIICLFFEKMPELSLQQASDCALQYICLMPMQSVNGLMRELMERDRLLGLRWDLEDQKPDMALRFPEGRYRIPFSVFKADLNELSMGDRGFMKPADIRVINGQGTITLTSKEIRYRSKSGIQFRGRLSRLACRHDGEFVEIRSKGSEYTLPLSYIKKLSIAPDGTLCVTFRIRAEVSSWGVDMPVSEADIIFQIL